MSFDEQSTSWFLAQLKPNSGHIAERNLKRQGFQTFLPLEDATKQVRGRFINALRPLFPGYIFVAFDITKGHWRAINSTDGVTRLVSFGKDPAPVPSDVVGQLMLRCDGAGRLLPPKLLKPGDQVRLSTGPFADFVATVESIAADRRVWVLLEIMGGQTRVGVAVEQLRVP